MNKGIHAELVNGQSKIIDGKDAEYESLADASNHINSHNKLSTRPGSAAVVKNKRNHHHRPKTAKPLVGINEKSNGIRSQEKDNTNGNTHHTEENNKNKKETKETSSSDGIASMTSKPSNNPSSPLPIPPANEDGSILLDKRVEKPARLSVTVPGSPFESGVNTECVQLLRQLWNGHEEAVQFLQQIRSTLTDFRRELRTKENEFESGWNKVKRSQNYGPSEVGSVPTTIKSTNEKETLEQYINGLKCISDSFADIDRQFANLSIFQTQCKLTLFSKVKHAKQQMTHDRLSIMHGIQELITLLLNMLATPTFWTETQVEDEKLIKYVHTIFKLAEVYNSVLELSLSHSTSTSAPSMHNNNSNMDSLMVPNPNNSEATSIKQSSTSSLHIYEQIEAVNRNDSALLRLGLKPMNGTRFLHILANKRSSFVSYFFSKTILSHFYAVPPNPQMFTPEQFQGIYFAEESGLRHVGKGFSQCPGLLGRAAVKKTENGDQHLTRSARMKIHSFFHQILWTLVGEHAEDLLVWCPSFGFAIPVILFPLSTSLSLRNEMTIAGRRFQESPVSPIICAFETISTSIRCFSLLTNWDEKMRVALDESFQVKRPEHISLVSKPDPAQWATEIGMKFGQLVTSCINMIDTGHVPHTNPTSLRSTNEEEPLGNEAQVFFRLEASLLYFKAWVVKRSKVWLNGWAIPQFLAISQREPALLVKLIKSREPLLITRDFLLNHQDIGIRLSAKHRKACCDDLTLALNQVQTMPDQLLLTIGPVCRTLSLATLQSYMDPPSFWRGLGSSTRMGQEKPSNYVNIFIGRVIVPVINASVELVPGPVQEAVGKQVVNASCDAWLQYILHKKIKFSDWGAVQLLRDFTALREWIRNETELDKDARKSILQLEILKTCEGVAYLLLRNPGDVLGVGKKASRKNRRVAPYSDSAQSTPSNAEHDSTADDDIPAEMYVPNQQMWLSLRLRRNHLTPLCC